MRTCVTALSDGVELVLLDVAYTDGGAERYQVLLRWGAEPIDEYSDLATIGTVDGPDGERVACDALWVGYHVVI